MTVKCKRLLVRKHPILCNNRKSVMGTRGYRNPAAGLTDTKIPPNVTNSNKKLFFLGAQRGHF
jgi:hypothetical protein